MHLQHINPNISKEPTDEERLFAFKPILDDRVAGIEGIQVLKGGFYQGQELYVFLSFKASEGYDSGALMDHKGFSLLCCALEA